MLSYITKNSMLKQNQKFRYLLLIIGLTLISLGYILQKSNFVNEKRVYQNLTNELKGQYLYTFQDSYQNDQLGHPVPRAIVEGVASTLFDGSKKSVC